MKDFIQKYRLQLILAVIGAVAGFFYWRFVGCQSGSCPLKSVWYYNVLFGGLIGYLLADMYVDYDTKRKEKAEKELKG